MDSKHTKISIVQHNINKQIIITASHTSLHVYGQQATVLNHGVYSVTRQTLSPGQGFQKFTAHYFTFLIQALPGPLLNAFAYFCDEFQLKNMFKKYSWNPASFGHKLFLKYPLDAMLRFENPRQLFWGTRLGLATYSKIYWPGTEWWPLLKAMKWH